MRNFIKKTTINEHTYVMFIDGTDGESIPQYGFAIDNDEVSDVTTETKIAMSIFERIVTGEASPLHLRDICEDAITEAAMV